MKSTKLKVIWLAMVMACLFALLNLVPDFSSVQVQPVPQVTLMSNSEFYPQATADSFNR